MSLHRDMYPTRNSEISSLVAVALLTAWGCGKKAAPVEGGAPPPPSTSAQPGACAGNGAKSSDPVSAPFFPQEIGSYCVDPHGETRAYGAQSSAPLDKACLEQFNGECEVYKSYGLDRVVTLRYVDGAGSQGEISVVLARFTSKEGAYGFYTKRVVGGQDPISASSEPLTAGGAAALGTGIAYVWRGLHVAQLAYTNIDQTPTDLAKTSGQLLPAHSRSIGEKLPGDLELPSAVSALPQAERVPLGTSYTYGELFGLEGVTGGAWGFYKAGDKRWRLLSMLRPDEDSAKDVLKSLAKQRGAKGEKNAPYDMMHFAIQSDESSPKAQWWVGRKGNRVFGIGDEDYVLTAETSKADQLKTNLDDTEKKRRLAAVLAGAGDAKPSPSAPSAPTPSSPNH